MATKRLPDDGPPHARRRAASLVFAPRSRRWKAVRPAAGAHARGLLQGWVELRKEHPELFEGVTIMQQPAGFVDAAL